MIYSYPGGSFHYLPDIDTVQIICSVRWIRNLIVYMIHQWFVSSQVRIPAFHPHRWCPWFQHTFLPGFRRNIISLHTSTTQNYLCRLFIGSRIQTSAEIITILLLQRPYHCPDLQWVNDHALLPSVRFTCRLLPENSSARFINSIRIKILNVKGAGMPFPPSLLI